MVMNRYRPSRRLRASMLRGSVLPRNRLTGRLQGRLQVSSHERPWIMTQQELTDW